MFIASKLADPCPITGTELVRYTNDTYNLTELLVSDLIRNIHVKKPFGGFGVSPGVPEHPRVSLGVPEHPWDPGPGFARDAQVTPA